MGRSRASKDQLALGGTVPRSKHAEGENVDKWIQKADVEKGALHSALDIKPNKRIPKARLQKALHSNNPHMRKMAQFAENVKH